MISKYKSMLFTLEKQARWSQNMGTSSLAKMGILTYQYLYTPNPSSFLSRNDGPSATFTNSLMPYLLPIVKKHTKLYFNLDSFLYQHLPPSDTCLHFGQSTTADESHSFS